ncbi:MAG: right-handed parallel beta-helix repeat-containing protein [Verrucomicrobiota bacterium]
MNDGLSAALSVGRLFLSVSLLMGTCLLFPALCMSATPYCHEYFVKPDGDDYSSGLAPGVAWATIQHAADLADPGDIVTVLDGEYPESVKIHRSGSSAAWITFRAQNRHRAKIYHPDRSCFDIGSDSERVGYVVIEGFDIKAPGVYGKGISSNRGAHHLRIVDNYAHDCGESGISLADGDYRFVEHNIATRNGWLMPDCGSGITMWGLQPFDDGPGWHNIVRSNVSFANDNGPTTKRTDGNGIIIDDFRNVQGGHTGAPAKNVNYSGCRTLIEGNLCFGNGGRGIQVFISNDVLVVNNTVFCNNTRSNDGTTWRGELSASCSGDVTFANNLAVTNSDSSSNALASRNSAVLSGALKGDYAGSDYKYFNNLTFDLANPSSRSWCTDGIEIEAFQEHGNLLATDPLLPAEQTKVDGMNVAKVDALFALPPDSPARLKGDPRHVTAQSDLPGNLRMTPQHQVDLGAIQSTPSNTRAKKPQ